MCRIGTYTGSRYGGIVFRFLAILLISGALISISSVEVEAGGIVTKDITLYLQNCTESKMVGSVSTTRILNTTIGENLNVTQETSTSLQADWYAYPLLPGDVEIEGEVTLHIWCLRTAKQGDSRQVTLNFELYDVDEGGDPVEEIASGSVNEPNMINVWKEYHITADNVSTYNVASGHSLRLFFELLGSSSNDYQISWGDPTYNSRLDVETYDYVLVEDVEVLDSTGKPTVSLDTLSPSRDVTFRGNITDPFGGYDIRLVNLTLEGPDGVVIDDVPILRTSGYHNSFYNEYEYGWNYSGYSPGQYNLTVTAVDNTGFNYRYPHNPGDVTFGGHLESRTISFWIGGRPNQLRVTVKNNVSEPLRGAVVEIGVSSDVTDTNGNAILTSFNGTNVLRVIWQDVEVYEETILVSGDMNLSIEAGVFSPRFVILDDMGGAVEDAVVFVEHPNGTFLKSSWRTNENGSFEIHDMARGDYVLSVLWKGVEVFGGAIAVDGHGPINITTNIFIVDVSVIDDEGRGLELAQVLIMNSSIGMVMDSLLTDLNGNTTFRLPIGTYDIDVYWRNVLVYDDTRNYLVFESHSIVLRANIFTLTVTVIDTRNLELSNAQVIIGLDDDTMILDSRPTDVNGSMSTRLPEGSYNIRVYWRDLLVNSTLDYEFVGVQNLTIIADVYWVTVVALDSEGQIVQNVQVTLTHSSGQIYASGTTDRMGEFTARIPQDTYAITANWMDTLVLDEYITADTDEPIPLNLTIHYLTVEVIGSDDKGIGDVDIDVKMEGEVVISSETDKDGTAVFRLPASNYTVEISFRTTYYMTDVDISKTKKIDLDASKTLRFDLKEYPPPFYLTNLFFFVLSTIVIVVALLWLFHFVLSKPKTKKPSKTPLKGTSKPLKRPQKKNAIEKKESKN